MPTGSRRAPVIAGVSPAAPSSRNRFCSAIPSSTCCPVGDIPQRCALASFASRNTSLRVWRSKMPRRFTQGPRLVDTVTSGDVVTICSASAFSSPWPRPISARISPKPACVDILRPASFGTGSVAGTGTVGALSTRPSGVSGVANGHIGEEIPQLVLGNVQSFEHIPLMARADAHRRCGTPPSAPSSSARHGCPCGRRTADPCP